MNKNMDNLKADYKIVKSLAILLNKKLINRDYLRNLLDVNKINLREYLDVINFEHE